jgi:hypothetical protein
VALFLFPLKEKLVSVARRWLRGLQSSGTPLVVGTVLLPVTVVDATGTLFVNAARDYAFHIAIGGLAVPVAYLIIYVWLGRAFMDTLFTAFYFVYDTIGYFKALWVSCVHNVIS